MPQVDDLKVGTQIGEFRITNLGSQQLRIAIPLTVPLILLVVAAAFAAPAVTLALPSWSAGQIGTAIFGQGKLVAFLWICAFAASAVGIPQIGRSYVFDGRAKQLCSVRCFMKSYVTSVDMDSLHLDVYHEGPHEAMRLWISLRHSTKPLEIARVSASKEGSQLAALAAYVSALLEIPIHRSGTPLYAGVALSETLETIQPEAAPGDAHDIHINCPACGAKEVGAVWYEEKEKFHGITVKTLTWVKCQACGTRLYSKMRGENLLSLRPAQLDGVVVLRTSLIASALAIIAISLCIIPFIGMGLAIVATLLNGWNQGWAKKVSLVALGISVLPTAVVIFVMKGGLRH